MSGLARNLQRGIGDVLDAAWSMRDGRVVPRTEDFALANGAVKLHAVMLYADLARSTELALGFDRRVAAKIVRTYLSPMTKLVAESGGVVRSFDGDRVMGVFVGDIPDTKAAECALKMNYMVDKSARADGQTQVFLACLERVHDQPLRGNLTERCPGRPGRGSWNQRPGLDRRRPNIAAKLSEIRKPPWKTYITKNVYDRLEERAKRSKDGRKMLKPVTREISGKRRSLYKSSWTREP